MAMIQKSPHRVLKKPQNVVKIGPVKVETSYISKEAVGAGGKT